MTGVGKQQRSLTNLVLNAGAGVISVHFGGHDVGRQQIGDHLHILPENWFIVSHQHGSLQPGSGWRRLLVNLHLVGHGGHVAGGAGGNTPDDQIGVIVVAAHFGIPAIIGRLPEGQGGDVISRQQIRQGWGRIRAGIPYQQNVDGFRRPGLIGVLQK